MKGGKIVKKDIKKLYIYAAIMLVFVTAIVLVVSLSENRIDNYQTEYENKIMVGQAQIENLEKRIVELEEENHKLKQEIENKLTIQTELDTQVQVMNDLTEIYKLIKDGKISDAKEKFSKIETNGFDDSSLAFYEAIKKILEK